MKLFDRIFSRMGYVNRKRLGRAYRNFAAAKIDRLTEDWKSTIFSSDAELRYKLRIIRARSRQLYNNNDYVRKFIRLVSSNVVGVNGIVFQNKAKLPNGDMDKQTNSIIESGFKDWGRRENVSVTGRLSWKGMQRLFIETVARDGEVFIRKVRGFPNRHGFALQFLEADYVPEDLNEDLRNGNQIRMGVEFDTWRKPVAYYFLTSHPGDYISQIPSQKYTRIPSDEIIHAFIQERPGQTRGVPWAVAAMLHLQMIGGYEEAELVAARVASAKMGGFKSESGESFTGDDQDASGNALIDLDPGSFFNIPKGMDLVPWDPQHPTTAYRDFLKAALRGVSSGLNVSHHSLASDLEGVNFSSIRQGVLDERDQWKMLQGWMIDEFCEPIESSWLDMAILSGAIELDASRISDLHAPKWQPRGWSWVDPQKDTNASIDAIEHLLKTRSMVLAEQGLDIEDVFEQLKAEKELAESLGLSIEKESTASSPGPSQELTDEVIEDFIESMGSAIGENGNGKNKNGHVIQNV